MTIKDFEKNISSDLLDRGNNYFMEECVDNLDEVDSGLWMAQVYGTHTYTVEVRTHKTQIKGWDCNCPYDHGPICKHVIATFYAIAENMELKKSQSKQKTGKKKGTKKNKLNEIFNKTSKEDLQKFIVSQFKRDYGLRNALIAHFAELLSEDSDKKYHTIIQHILKASIGLDGFIDYYSEKSLTNPLFDLVRKSEDFIVKKNITEALSITKALLEEVPDFYNYMEDSDGYLMEVIENAFDIFSIIAEKASPLLKDEMFNYCISEYPKEENRNFDIDTGFLHLLPQLITTDEQEKKFFDFIDLQIEVEKKKDNYDYRIVSLIEKKINYLQWTNRENEAQTLIETNKNYTTFREILINQAISKKKLILAGELCNEGIAIAEKKHHSGIVDKWHNKLLEIAEKAKNKNEIRKWSEKLYFDNYFSMKYYRKLKSTYSKDEWQNKSDKIINHLQGKDQRGGYDELTALAKIFIEEKYLSRLLKLVQINSGRINLIDDYAIHLQKLYPAEILSLYDEGIKEYAKSTGREIYNEIVGYMKKMEKIKGGKGKVKALIKYFREQYQNRRAMMEILNDNFPETIPINPSPY